MLAFFKSLNRVILTEETPEKFINSNLVEPIQQRLIARPIDLAV